MSTTDLFERLASTGLIHRLIELARDEDLGPDSGLGDVTSTVVVEPDRRITASIVMRDAGVVCGLATLPILFEVFETDAEYEARAADGDAAQPGTVIGVLDGDQGDILVLERTLLNLLGRLCGVATHTRRFVDVIEGTSATIFDTRKTTPGLRALEKYAVACGGGDTHRLGLYDGVLIKDNHLAHIPLDELTAHVGEAARQAWPMRMDQGLAFVEVEVDSMDQLERVLAVEHGLIDFVLLDNFSLDDLRASVTRRDQINRDIKLEASGGITLDSVRDIAETGVDRISCGALTHHAVWLDVALDIEEADAPE